VLPRPLDGGSGPLTQTIGDYELGHIALSPRGARGETRPRAICMSDRHVVPVIVPTPRAKSLQSLQ
jgi:hypothetical protein